MARFVFDATKVLELVEHSKTGERQWAYGIGKGTPKPGLFLVKDQGVYVLSNAKLGKDQTPSNTGMIAYANGYGANADWDKVRDAAGGDDFAENVEIGPAFQAALKSAQKFVIYLTPKTIRLSVEGKRSGA